MTDSGPVIVELDCALVGVCRSGRWRSEAGRAVDREGLGFRLGGMINVGEEVQRWRGSRTGGASGRVEPMGEGGGAQSSRGTRPPLGPRRRREPRAPATREPHFLAVLLDLTGSESGLRVSHSDPSPHTINSTPPPSFSPNIHHLLPQMAPSVLARSLPAASRTLLRAPRAPRPVTVFARFNSDDAAARLNSIAAKARVVKTLPDFSMSNKVRAPPLRPPRPMLTPSAFSTNRLPL